MAGTVVLLVRRQLSNMASRIGQRVVGSILGRLVSMVAGGVGLILIAKDIWDFRHGVLPIIATEMKSKETKDKVREELAKSVSEQIGDSIKEISDQTADRVVEIWLEFRRAHAKVVELADRQEVFKRFLDTVKPDDLPRARRGRGAGAGERGRGRHRQAARQRHAASRRQRRCRPAPSRSPARRDRWRRRCSGRRWRATAWPRWSSSRSTGGPSPTPSPRRACSGCSACRTASPSRGLPRCSRRPATRCSSWTRTSSRRWPARLDEPQLDSLSRYLTGLDKSSAQRVLHVVGADARAHGRARQAERARRASCRAATRLRPSA